MNKIQKTIGIIWAFFPAVFLLPLAILPPNLGTAGFWLLGVLFVLFAVGSIVFNLVSFILNKKEKNKLVFLRPVLTIVMFTLCCFSIYFSQNRAISFARKTAVEIQELIDNEECPRTLTGWNNHTSEYGFSSTKRIKTISSNNLTYLPADNCESFELRVYINIDSDHVFSGGKNKTLHEERTW